MRKLEQNSLKCFYSQYLESSEKEIMDAVNESLRSNFGQPENPEKTGLYLISPNAGFISAVAFWKEVLAKSPGLANPELFPWTLANSSCSAVARAFGIKGPNYTFTESFSGFRNVIEQVDFDFNVKQTEIAWVIAIDFKDNNKDETQLSAFKILPSTNLEKKYKQFDEYVFSEKYMSAKNLYNLFEFQANST
jgi:hypothetical protein